MSIIILLAFLLDMILGDPVRPTHPVVIIGKLIDSFEKNLRKLFKTPRCLKTAGVILWFATVLLVYIATYCIIKITYKFNPWFGYVTGIWLTYTTLSVRNLADEAMGIYHEIRKSNIGSARKRLSFIVGRDTADMPVNEICRATIETVAENTIDGIISPLLYAFIGGAPLAMAYKAVNTLDSMVGYKNEKYEFLGWFSAHMDDLANFIPARIGGILMLMAATVIRLDIKRGIKTVLADAKKHKSPNSGIPEAITAGVLGIRLGGWNSYGGEMSFREYMGEKLREIEAEDIKTTVKLSLITAIIALIIGEIILDII
ncbi:adenosylcobinamide-phosphate synthase CbiB [Tepidanaerobacter acetatoxydans]|uniref:adenosylcobinamide-phosphate synthase CbiB n=1 Tax=Tepidanaerobacter acetatoxydans TaxID=499229 RepID=UPI001BD5E160|nr:adenosylcobinamide-phosphate synthase CbiB [Tepidanaerobacter acetatoxydans]